MTKQLRILNTISQIRNSHSKQESIFLYGSCLNFYLILHSIYPEAKPFFNVDHIITEIDGKYYDITGQILNVKGYAPYTSYYNKKTTSKSFSRMNRCEFLLEDTLPF